MAYMELNINQVDVLLKWINGEEVPAPPRPNGPMPRVPFYGVSKKENNKQREALWNDRS